MGLISSKSPPIFEWLIYAQWTERKDNPEEGKETAQPAKTKQNKTKPRNCKDVDPVQASRGLLTFRLPCSLLG